MQSSGIRVVKDTRPNIVFLGSSASYRYFIPPLLFKKSGVTSYVIGSSAQPFSATPSLITESEAVLHPSLYVIEIRRLIVNDVYKKKGIEDPNQKEGNSSHKTAYDNNPMNQFINTFFWQFTGKKKDNSMQTLSFTNQEKLYNGDITVDFFRRQSEWDPSSYRTKRTPLRKDSKAILTGVLDLCKDQNLNVLFISTPYVENESFITEENYVSDLIKSCGYSYLNLNYYYKNIGINFSTDFYDQRHVNILGAVKVTDYFAKCIKNNNTFLRGSTPGIKAYWEKNYKTWVMSAERQKQKVYRAINKIS